MGKRWTVEEDRTVMRKSCPDHVCAKLLCRTVGAVRRRRWLLWKRMK